MQKLNTALILITAILFTVFMVSCGNDNDEDDNSGKVVNNENGDNDELRRDEISDLEDFIEQLRGTRAEVSLSDKINQPFFFVEGQILTIDDGNVQVFEYTTEKTTEDEALLVSPDGSSIGQHLVNWIAPPHFYKKNKLIVLYVGSDTKLINTLEEVLGKQFAGR